MTLFWKIFLSFWLGLVLFTGASIFMTSTYLEKIRSEQASFQPRAHLLARAREAQDVANREGYDGLKAWLKNIDHHEAIPILMIDEFGEELLGRDIRPSVRKRLHRIQERLNDRNPRKKMFVVELEDDVYHMIPDYQSITLARVLHRPKVILLPLLLAAMVSAVIGLLLARYLVAPIRQLSRATHAYADGDLTQRVTPSLGSRRDEIANLAGDFDHMAERLQAVLHSQEQLLSDVSHELRSPLARIQAALGLAQKKCKGTAETEITRIEQEAERLDKMIGQLLSLSRLQSERQPQPFAQINLTDLITTIVENADFEAQSRQRSVKLVAAKNIAIDADANLLGSALENIIRNAIRYTDKNTSVTVSMEQSGETVTIVICDHGPGVPEEMLDRIFEPFVRVGSARDRESGGHGLGMSIAYRAIQYHQGSITAFNQKPGGLCVSIELPYQTKSSLT